MKYILGLWGGIVLTLIAIHVAPFIGLLVLLFIIYSANNNQGDTE